MKIVFRTDASTEIGSGHIMRCLTLADQLRVERAEIVFICRDLPGAMFDMLSVRGYRYTKLPFIEAGNHFQSVDAKETIEAIGEIFPDGFDWLVIDHYKLDDTWERLIRSKTRKLMVIDDLANRQHDCDLLLDQNYYSNLEQRYNGLVSEHCITLLGPTYVLLRPEFIEARKRLRTRNGNVRRILVFMGGSDPQNHTQKVIESIKILCNPNIEVDILVGTANPKLNIIKCLCDELPNISFHCQVSNMSELIQNADIGIGAGGASMWERCCLGLPTITVVFAANQERTTEDVAAIGAINYLGWADNLEPEDYAYSIAFMIDNPEAVKQMSNAALGVIKSVKRSVAEIMYSII